MIYIKNTGKAKQVILSNGLLKNISPGASSYLDDVKLGNLIKNDPTLILISEAEFLAMKKVKPTVEIIKEAKEARVEPKPPNKKKFKKYKKEEEEPVKESDE